jgi:hypothetical protein
MKLFAVRLADGTTLPQYFDDKMAAKKVRDQHPGAVVVLGPDHVRYTH